MSAKITWTVKQLDRQTSNGFVTKAYWEAIAEDGEYSASVMTSSSWPTGTVTTPYEQLTKDTVLGWIWANGVDKTAVEASLLAQIAQKKTPTTAKGLPWN